MKTKHKKLIEKIPFMKQLNIHLIFNNLKR